MSELQVCEWVHTRLMAAASAEGRAQFAGLSQVARAKSPEPSRLSQAARAKSPERVRQSQVARAKLPEPSRRSQPSEAEAWEACAVRWDRRVRVAAVTTAPKSPDHYSLGHAKTQQPKGAPRRLLKSVASVARSPSREPDPANYKNVYPRIPSRR